MPQTNAMHLPNNSLGQVAVGQMSSIALPVHESKTPTDRKLQEVINNADEPEVKEMIKITTIPVHESKETTNLKIQEVKKNTADPPNRRRLTRYRASTSTSFHDDKNGRLRNIDDELSIYSPVGETRPSAKRKRKRVHEAGRQPGTELYD